MPSLKVTGGPSAPSGKVLAAGTALTIRFLDTYVDGGTRWPREHRAEYDVSYGGWKPLGAGDGADFYTPGGSSGAVKPPKAVLTEQQVYTDGTSQKFIDTIEIYATSSGEWFYATPASDAIYVSNPNVPPAQAVLVSDVDVPGGVASYDFAKGRLGSEDIGVPGGVAAFGALQDALGPEDIDVLGGVSSYLNAESKIPLSQKGVPGGVATQDDLDAAEADIATNTGDISAAEADILALQQGQASAIIAYATKADLDADLAHPEGTPGLVTNDTTTANNGFYRKTGASGSGSWVQSSYDRVALVEGDVSTLQGNVSTLQSDLATAQSDINDVETWQFDRVYAASTKQAVDLPSSYPDVDSVAQVDSADGWPTAGKLLTFRSTNSNAQMLLSTGGSAYMRWGAGDDIWGDWYVLETVLASKIAGAPALEYGTEGKLAQHSTLTSRLRGIASGEFIPTNTIDASISFAETENPSSLEKVLVYQIQSTGSTLFGAGVEATAGDNLVISGWYRKSDIDALLFAIQYTIRPLDKNGNLVTGGGVNSTSQPQADFKVGLEKSDTDWGVTSTVRCLAKVTIDTEDWYFFTCTFYDLPGNTVSVDWYIGANSASLVGSMQIAGLSVLVGGVNAAHPLITYPELSQPYSIDYRSSDKIILLSNSYGAGRWCIKDKQYLQNVSMLTDWLFTNYSKAGDDYHQLLTRVRNDESRFSATPISELGASYGLIVIDSNNGAFETVDELYTANNLKALIETIQALGITPIIATEFFYSGDPTSGTGRHERLHYELAQRYGCHFVDITRSSYLMDPDGVYGAPQFWGNNHPGVRTSWLWVQPMLEGLGKLPRPRQGLKIFRKRPGVTVSSVDDLLYDLNTERAELFKELRLGQDSLDDSQELL